MSTTGKLNVLIGANAENFYSAIGGVQKRLQGVSKDLDRISKDISMKVSAPLALLGGVALNTFSTFEDSMLKVKSLTGATDEQFKELNKTAKTLGATTRFSGSEVGDAMGYMALAGWDTTKIIQGLDGVLNLAAGSGEDLAKVSDILTDGLSAFGKEASYSARMADILAMASAKSNTSIGLMGEAFKYVAPLAGALKFAVEDTNLALGLMANAGIKGSQAGTSLKNTINRLVAPTKESQTALENLGYTAINTDGSVKPLAQILEELRGKFSGLTTSQKAQNAGLLAGKDAMSGLLAIINASDDDFYNLQNNLINSEGQAKIMAETLESGLGGAFRRMKSNIESVLIMIGENLAPLVINISDVVGKVTQVINDLSPSFQRVVTVIGVILAVVPPLIVAFGSIIKIVTSSIVAIKTLLPLLAGISAPVLAIAAGVGAAVYLIIKYWDEIKEYFTNGDGSTLTNSITELWNGSMQKITEAVKEVVKFTKELWSKYGQDVKDIFSGLFGVVYTQITNLLNIIGLLIRGITTTFRFFLKLFTGDFKGAFNVVKDFALDIFKTIVSTIAESFKSILNIAGTLAEKLGFEKINKGIEGTISWLDKLKYSATTTAEGVSELGDEVAELNETLNQNNNTDFGTGVGNGIRKNIIEPIREVKREFDLTASLVGNKVNEMGKKLLESSLTIQGSFENVNWTYEQYMSYFHEFENGTYVALQGILSIGDGIQQMFLDLFRTGQLSFKGLIRQIGMFIAKLLSAIAAAAILNVLTGGLFAGKGAVKSAFSFTNLLSQFSGGMFNFPLAGSRAGGGDVDMGKAYLVGERGRELFIPNTGGTVVSSDSLSKLNNRGSSSAGGGEVTFKIKRDTLVGILKQDERFKERF
ncbi:phage tail tape measure protein [Belliella pelovolcani]|uniref:Phage tail tape measure protein, TP901 family, core region n=1 Tax=Belliella pelovolcani TaxID=529505 RepID=A0A1N7MQX6_9BACT|nr:phage tail tape measure protein [Belliella pelovolcani]SIS88523.1 phage tail tape measure protein, TP901 family, core region [Belliella pelovolcani]